MDSVVLFVNFLKAFSGYPLLFVVLLFPFLFIFLNRRGYFLNCCFYNVISLEKNDEEYAVESFRLSRSARMAALNYVDLDYFNVTDRTLDNTICSLNSSHLSRRSVNASNNFVGEKDATDDNMKELDVSSQIDTFETPPSAFRSALPRTRRPISIFDRLK